MSELDKKLNELLSSVYYAGSQDVEQEFYGNNNDQVEEIKEAFIYDGWINTEDHEFGEKCMTGQEWYERFFKEVGKFSQAKADAFARNPTYLYEYMIDAAKKSSGLNNEQGE